MSHWPPIDYCEQCNEKFEGKAIASFLVWKGRIRLCVGCAKKHDDRLLEEHRQ